MPMPLFGRTRQKNGIRPAARRGWLGQSMMEAIIASGIIATAVSSALTLVQVSISSERDSEMSVVAGNLAREGVEVVRAIRDSNWLAGDAWDEGLEGEANEHTATAIFTPSDKTWALDFSADSVTDPAAKVYRYSGNVGDAVIGLMVQADSQPANTLTTGYGRLITIDSICDLEGTIREDGTACATERIGMRVRSLVRYNVGSKVRTIEVEESLFNWR